MHARSRHALHTALVAGLMVAAATRPANAQALAPQALAPQALAPQALASQTPRVDVAAPKASTSGPTVMSAAVAVRPVDTKELQLNAAAAPRRAGYGQPVALMVVGGAALITGLIIGHGAGTVIAVGGTAMGLYGLYEYLQ